MAICPHCNTKGANPYEPCPSGDGFYLIEDDDYRDHRDDPWVGRRLGDRFIICSLLGTGSMARVYVGYQKQVDRLVALKLFEAGEMADTDGNSPDDRDRFVREARVLGQLSHPNCVTLYDFGYIGDSDYLYIAMEHVAGLPLRRAVRRGMKFDALVEVVRQVLMALREAHALDIVHRDLKPENIILSHRKTGDEQIVKVLDFGIAKLVGGQTAKKTRAGLLFGTPAYMSPEQCRGETEITPASDIYSFGCILFELVSGTIPYNADIPQDLVRQHQFEPIPQLTPRSGLETPDGFETFVRTCMQKEPEDRYGDAATALAAFEEIVGGETRATRLANIDGDTRQVAVPDTNLSGVQLNPTGEHTAPELGEIESAISPSVTAAQPQRRGGRHTTAKKQDVSTTDTVRDSSETTARSWSDWFGGRAGLAVAAILMVLLFCSLLFTYIYLMMGG